MTLLEVVGDNLVEVIGLSFSTGISIALGIAFKSTRDLLLLLKVSYCK